MDCSTCFYPNDDETRFCTRCAAPLGMSVTQLPVEPSNAPAREIAEMFAGGVHEAKAALRRQGGAGGLDASLLGGKYRLLRPLGSGGFGSVYEAEETFSGLHVAVKLLNHTALLDGKMRQRFLQEARMIAELRSPHVVVLHDYAVTEQGIPYLVMELLSGKPASHDMLAGPWSPRRAVRVLAQVCAALGEAHEHGIVHRDIKPDNILILDSVPPSVLGPALPRLPDGTGDFVKVVDFGVARFSGLSTRASDILGTPAYISPETLADEPVDGRSDLYAVGMLLWQMIVGDLPFPGKNQAAMMKSHLDAPRFRPREINAAYRLPDALEDLMKRLVARYPADRPSSAFSVHALMLEMLAVPNLLSDKPLRGASYPDFGPHWDAPASEAAEPWNQKNHDAVTVALKATGKAAGKATDTGKVAPSQPSEPDRAISALAPLPETKRWFENANGSSSSCSREPFSADPHAPTQVLSMQIPTGCDAT